ncbi:MAG: BON domain-containing protein [Spirochaetaceae bacterium]|nr:MAG: BON domain-containing protein [Spirochaetaceae bacterium]
MADNEELQDRIRKVLNDDPTISDPTRISIVVQKEGPLFRKKEVVKISGKVAHEAEKKKVEAIVSQHAGDRPVENTLTVSDKAATH